MLPDLPIIKAELQMVLTRYLRTKVDHRLGVFRDVPKHIVHEGKSMRIRRADGSIEDSGLKTASAEISIKQSDVPALTPRERILQLDRMAEEMAQQMSKLLFGSLEATLDRAGQAVHLNGKPFNAEAILSTLEKMEIDFDQNGTHQPITIVGNNPDLVRRALEQLESHPPLKTRYDELMNKKRAEWGDREANRKLVG
jgi:hypothetical protein